MTQRKPFILTCTVLALTTLTLVGFRAAEAAGSSVSLDELPPAIRAELTNRLAGATIVEIERDTEHGRAIIEIEAKNPDGTTVDLIFAADGRFLRAEGGDADDDNADDDGEGVEDDEGIVEVITLDQAPGAVRDALQGFTTPDHVLKVERITEGDESGDQGEADDADEADDVVYEIDFTDDKGESSVRMTALGDVLAVDHEIAEGALPALILAELHEEVPGAVIGDVNIAQVIVYEIEYTLDGRTHEIALDASGEPVFGARHGDDDDDEADDDGDGDGEQDDD
ncbi:MAG: PepSY-like domain-containing protein [Phycisphaeraceae bacterium]|nr:PepSY-like domain-containing protein [Phycisphaeraceae bacterium]MCB9847816.1 PepSY-like domain-containing protein [Phycisphaeraceae bacterium]